MLKTEKKNNLEEQELIIDEFVPNKLSTYKDLLRKYKIEGNKAKEEEYERLIDELKAKSTN